MSKKDTSKKSKVEKVVNLVKPKKKKEPWSEARFEEAKLGLLGKEILVRTRQDHDYAGQRKLSDEYVVPANESASQFYHMLSHALITIVKDEDIEYLKSIALLK